MELEPKVFDAPVRTDLLHAVVVDQLARRRRGTAATKNRALVSGGGAKPFRQKGSGRARQGSSRVSQMEGGGVVFGPQPRSYAQRIPKKVRRAALCSALSMRKQEDRIIQVDTLELPETKTRLLAARLRELGCDDALVVTPVRDPRLELASRNLATVKVLPVEGLNVRDVLARRSLVLVGDAPAAIAERLQR